MAKNPHGKRQIASQISKPSVDCVTVLGTAIVAIAFLVAFVVVSEQPIDVLLPSICKTQQQPSTNAAEVASLDVPINQGRDKSSEEQWDLPETADGSAEDRTEDGVHTHREDMPSQHKANARTKVGDSDDIDENDESDENDEGDENDWPEEVKRIMFPHLYGGEEEVSMSQTIRNQMKTMGRFDPPYKRDSPVTEVPHLNELPTKEAFYSAYAVRNRPVLFRNGQLHADALRKWSHEYLESIAGGLKMPVESSSTERYGYEEKSWGRASMNYGDFLRNVTVEGILNPYVAYDVPLEMAKDLELPQFVPCLSGQTNLIQAHLWHGRGASKSLMHSDQFENLYSVIEGEKRLALVDGLSGKAICERVDSKVSKTSPVDTSRSYEENLKVCPSFAEVNVLHVTVRKGDVLYLPSFWYHQVESTEPSIAITLWFDLFGTRRRLKATDGAYFTSEQVLTVLLTKPEPPVNSKKHCTAGSYQPPKGTLHKFCRQQASDNGACVIRGAKDYTSFLGS